METPAVNPAATGEAAVAVVPVASVFPGFWNSSLYVGDLDPTVNEAQLADLFSHVGPVISVRVCRDQTKRSSLGYAYVNYTNPQHAANAMEILNFSPINGKPIRIMFSHRDPSIRKSGHGNIFIKNLDSTIDNKALHDTFAVFGTVLSCKIVVDSNGQSRGYGFVQFENEESAQNAIRKLNGMLMNGKKVYVGHFVRRQERNQANGSSKFTNVFVKNLSDSATEDDLNKVFGSYGDITSLVVMRDGNGKSRCFGFVNYQSHEAAAAAVDGLNGFAFDGKVWYVGKAQRKVERELELRAKFEQIRSSKYEKLQGANLYLKNLDDKVNDEKLKDLFSEFGNISSCKVMLDPQGVSRGCGFVAFSTPEEAAKAMNAMNGKMIGRRPLYVAVAQRKEERKAKLQAHFSQVQTGSGLAPLPSGIPAFQSGTPRVAPQQLYYGPGLMHPQPAGYAFKQQLLPGMRQAVPQNFVMPYNIQRQQGQAGQRMGVRRGGNAQHMHQQGIRYMQNARNGLEPSQGLVGAAMMPVQRSGPLPIATLTSSLASATPDQQKEILGGELYPLVQRLAPNQVSKVTGMLLEMDQPEVLHLIESPDALETKVEEALKVLAAAESQCTDQIVPDE